MPHFTPTEPPKRGAFTSGLRPSERQEEGSYASFHFGIGQAGRARSCRHRDDVHRRLDDFFRFRTTACGAKAGACATRGELARQTGGTRTDTAGSASAACAALTRAARTARSRPRQSSSNAAADLFAVDKILRRPGWPPADQKDSAIQS